MTAEERRQRQIRFARIRLLKRFLRPLPRRANLHRYPVIRSFSTTARKRRALWSFRKQEVWPAILVGCILTFLPLYGVQIPLAFALALLMRVNLPILVGLQLLSNPFTVGPMWYANYQLGNWLLDTIFGASPDIDIESIRQAETVTPLEAIRVALGNGAGEAAKRILHFFEAVFLGGLIIGSAVGLIAQRVWTVVFDKPVRLFVARKKMTKVE